MPRYAIFLTSLPGDALTLAAARWLGRDAFTGKAVPAPSFEQIAPQRIAELTQTASIYGFHGTLKAPFCLAEGVTEADLAAAFDAYCDAAPPLAFPTLEVGSLDGFTALLPGRANPDIHALADAAVEYFDGFRRPASDAEIARRDVPSMTAAERRNLEIWGYPYVMEQFRYHMTLTRRLAAGEQSAILPVLQDWFAPALRGPTTAALAIFVQRNADAPFVVHSWRPLGAAR